MCVRVRISRGKAATAVFHIDRATKATAGLEPQIQNLALTGGRGRRGGGGGLNRLFGQ